MKAKFIKKLEGFRGNAGLYHVEPAVKWGYGEPKETSFVIVSAVNDSYAHETFIFPANEEGKILDWSELEGSMTGTTSHEEALNAQGYELEEDDSGAPGTSGYFSMRD
jgi:hypothetical protein